MPRDVPVTVRALARAEPGRVFDAIVPIPLETIFHGFGPVPAVLGVRDQTGLWDHAGASRTVLLADGSEAHETLAWHDRPRGFGYRLEPGPGSSLGRVVESARGTWDFSPAAGGGTAIAWTYTFRPRRGRGSAVRGVLAPVWRQAAKRALALAVQEADRR
jgi:Polyketide cyclase / dehydrase and lipid transport